MILNKTICKVLIFFVVAYMVYMIAMMFLYTMVNPILSDSFGLTVQETSYFFTVLLVINAAGSFLA